jgi:hypothetical protein
MRSAGLTVPLQTTWVVFCLVGTVFASNCSLFKLVPGLEVEPAVGFYVIPSNYQWIPSMCSAINPNAVMAMPTTVAFGASMCSNSYNTYQWAGLSWNNTFGIWTWIDGTNVTTRPVIWSNSSFGSNPTPQGDCYQGSCINNGTCGQISCADGSMGKLYMGWCAKYQTIICQVKRKHNSFLSDSPLISL